MSLCALPSFDFPLSLPGFPGFSLPGLPTFAAAFELVCPLD